MPDLSPYLDWIEAHKTTVDLVKWGLLLFIAWIAGAFRFLRGITRKPNAEIQAATSRCLIQEFSEFGGHTNVIRVIRGRSKMLVNTIDFSQVLRQATQRTMAGQHEERREEFSYPWSPVAFVGSG